jgi:hypothetical protein
MIPVKCIILKERQIIMRTKEEIERMIVKLEEGIETNSTLIEDLKKQIIKDNAEINALEWCLETKAQKAPEIKPAKGIKIPLQEPKTLSAGDKVKISGFDDFVIIIDKIEGSTCSFYYDGQYTRVDMNSLIIEKV